MIEDKLTPQYIANMADNLYRDLTDESVDMRSVSYEWLDKIGDVLTMTISKN